MEEIQLIMEETFVKLFNVIIFESINYLVNNLYSLRFKSYDVLGVSHVLKYAINIVWKRDIMSCFTKLSLINNMKMINERTERR